MATGTRTPSTTPTTTGRCAWVVPERGEPLFGFASLHRAWQDCRRGKGDSPARWRFEADLERNLFQLADELSTRRYRPSPSVCFVSDQPKRREIFAAAFRDRVVHHLLVRELEPYWERRFIHDSYACRHGKGTLAAVDRVQQFIRQVSANGSVRAWYLHLDVRSFFVRIDKAILLRIVEQGIARQALPHAEQLVWLASTIIQRDPSEDAHRIGRGFSAVPEHKSLYHTHNLTGLPIGNYSSQFLANVYLDPLDQFIKHQLRARHYLRYVDDLLLLDRDPNRLQMWEAAINDFLRDRLALDLNPNARKLAPVNNGIDALGYVVHADHRLLRRRTVRRFRQHLAKAERDSVRVRDGIVSVRITPKRAERWLARCASYAGLLRHANAYRLTSAIEGRHGWLRTLWSMDKRGRLRRRWLPAGTPRTLRQQWQALRALYAGHVVWMRLGRFWECFDSDARLLQRRMGLRPGRPRRGFHASAGLLHSPSERLLEELASKGIPSVLVDQGSGFRGGLRCRQVVRVVGTGCGRRSCRWVRAT